MSQNSKYIDLISEEYFYFNPITIAFILSILIHSTRPRFIFILVCAAAGSPRPYVMISIDLFVVMV
jgi:hypothetical protein